MNRVLEPQRKRWAPSTVRTSDCYLLSQHVTEALRRLFIVSTTRISGLRGGLRKSALRLLFLIVLASLAISVSWAIAPTTVRADHDGRDVKDTNAARYGTGWYRGVGGGTGLNGFHYTYTDASSDAYAMWWMGNMRGKFKLKVYIPKKGASRNSQPREATANVLYRVQEHIDGQGWRTIRSFRMDQSKRTGWRTFLDPVPLNGRVRVILRVDEARLGDYAKGRADRIAVDTVELQHHHYHPEDTDIAVAACKQDVNVRLWLSRENYARECELRYSNGYWAWLPRPFHISHFLSDLHDSKGRAVPSYVRDIGDILAGGLGPPGFDMQYGQLSRMTPAERTEVTDALLKRWPRGVFK